MCEKKNCPFHLIFSYLADSVNTMWGDPKVSLKDKPIMYCVLALMFGGVLLIFFSANPMGWIVAIGSVLSGVGTIIAVVFARDSVAQSNRMHEDNIKRNKVLEFRNDVKELIHKLENTMQTFTYTDSKSAPYMGENVLLYYLNENLTFPTMAELEKVENTCEINRFIVSYTSLLFLIYNNNDREYLHKYYTFHGYSDTAVSLVFITAAKYNINETCNLIVQNSLFGRYDISYFVMEIARNILGAIRADTIEERSFDLAQMFELIDIIIGFDNSNNNYSKIFPVISNNEVDAFNTLASRAKATYRLAYSKIFNDLLKDLE